jgi:uncharacterized SAM-binding protein YcdF (DUF218 family)
MKETIKIIIAMIITASFVYQMLNMKYKKEVGDLQIKYEKIILVNSELQQKINSADEVYEALRKRENYLNSRVKKSKLEISEQDRLIDDLINIKVKYEADKEKFDSIKSVGPNRDKEDLINSLKIKTNI